MKFIKQCIVVGLLIGVVVHGKADVNLSNEETEAILQKIKELERTEQRFSILIEKKEDRQDKLKNQLNLIRECLKKERALLDIPHPQPRKNWTKIVFASAGILTLTAATGGLAGGGVALLIKGTALTAAQWGGVAGGLVGAHGVGDALYKTGDVDFDKVARKSVPRAAIAGGAVGGVCALGTGACDGFDGGLGGILTAYLNDGDKQQSIRLMDPTQQLKQQHKKVYKET